MYVFHLKIGIIRGEVLPRRHHYFSPALCRASASGRGRGCNSGGRKSESTAADGEAARDRRNGGLECGLNRDFERERETEPQSGEDTLQRTAPSTPIKRESSVVLWWSFHIQVLYYCCWLCCCLVAIELIYSIS